jgi:pilus assembly protein CpaD
MRRRGAWVRVCALGLTVGLQACADRPSLPVPNIASGTPNPIQISRTQIAHAVTFPPGAAELEAPQVSALIAFIAANGVGPKDTILIEHDGELVGQAHAETVSAQLVAIGLRPSIVAAANLTSGVARVVVERYIAIPPDCPDWSHKPSPNFQNYDQRNFGCADAVNLAAMVADPKDLAMGAAMGPQVGDPVTKPIYEYRAGTPGGAAVAAGGAAAGGAAAGAGSSGAAGAGPGSSTPSPTGP